MSNKLSKAVRESLMIQQQEQASRMVDEAMIKKKKREAKNSVAKESKHMPNLKFKTTRNSTSKHFEDFYSSDDEDARKNALYSDHK